MVSLLERIQREIQGSDNNWIRFDTYMQICLYEPEIGYYTNARNKVGRDGDFYTSSNIGSVMGEMLASSLLRIVTAHKKQDQKVVLVEWGGGTGVLAKQILDAWQNQNPEVYEQVMWLSQEISPHHRQLQTEQLHNHIGKYTFDETEIPSDAFLVGYANELFDAFPCRRFRKGTRGLEEMVVTIEQGSPKPIWIEADARTSQTYLAQWQHVQIGQQFERIEGITTWFNQDILQRMHTLIIIDYGDVQTELLAEHRMNGTFLCYYKHQANDDAFTHIGEQDMTCHVDFTQVEEEAKGVGFQHIQTMTQKQFLVESGLLDQLQEHAQLDPFHPIAKRNRRIRQLLWSDQMSELFKVCMLQKELHRRGSTS